MAGARCRCLYKNFNLCVLRTIRGVLKDIISTAPVKTSHYYLCPYSPAEATLESLNNAKALPWPMLSMTSACCFKLVYFVGTMVLLHERNMLTKLKMVRFGISTDLILVAVCLPVLKWTAIVDWSPWATTGRTKLLHDMHDCSTDTYMLYKQKQS